MYPLVLTIHSWLRWIAIIVGLWAVAQSVSAAARAGRPGPAGLVFTIVLDIQFLAGLVLFLALSPVTQAAMADMGAAMKNSAWRFWVVEHPVLMLGAVALAHIGRMVEKSKRPVGRRPLVWYALAVAALIIASPWPFMPQGRPWIRW